MCICIQWNLQKVNTIRSKRQYLLYGSVCFIEPFPKTQLFCKIWKQNQHLCYQIALSFTQEVNKNKNNKLEDSVPFCWFFIINFKTFWGLCDITQYHNNFFIQWCKLTDFLLYLEFMFILFIVILGFMFIFTFV